MAPLGGAVAPDAARQLLEGDLGDPRSQERQKSGTRPLNVLLQILLRRQHLGGGTRSSLCQTVREATRCSAGSEACKARASKYTVVADPRVSNDGVPEFWG